MTDFAVRFSKLQEILDDDNAEFFGAEMRDALLALVPDIPDKPAEARLFRELAVLEGKRDELVCLDYADSALAAHNETDALSADRLYFMHLVCGDVGTAWRGGPRTVTHLENALKLHAELARPVGEAFAIRLNRGVYEQSNGGDRLGLDWFEPLLADAKRHYGAQSLELGHLLGLMSMSEERLGNMAGALAYGERSFALVDDRADKGRRVSALVAHAKLQHRAGDSQKARRFFDDAISWAEAHCSQATQEFAREEKAQVFPPDENPSVRDRLRDIISGGKD